MAICDEITGLIEENANATIFLEKGNLYKDLGFDSLSFIRLLLKIEEIYSISFDIAEMECCLEVSQLIKLVEEKVKEKSKDDKKAAKGI